MREAARKADAKTLERGTKALLEIEEARKRAMKKAKESAAHHGEEQRIRQTWENLRAQAAGLRAEAGAKKDEVDALEQESAGLAKEIAGLEEQMGGGGTAEQKRELRAKKAQRGDVAVRLNLLAPKARAAAVRAEKAEKETEEAAAQASASGEKAQAAAQEAQAAGERAAALETELAQEIRLARAAAATQEEERRRECSEVLRRVQIDLIGRLREGGANPGLHKHMVDGKHLISLAPHMLAVNDSPWVGIWGDDQWDFQQRILGHELTHALDNSENRKRIRKFLEQRWNKQYGAFTKRNGKWKERIADVRESLEAKTSEGLKDPILRAWEEFARRRLENARLPEDERKWQEAVLARDLKISAAHLAAQKIAEEAGSRKPVLPSRFAGDEHGYANDKEYFAVAAELYLNDPGRFRDAYTPEEQAVMEELFDGDGIDDLEVGR